MSGLGEGSASLRIALVCDYSLDYLGGAQSAFLDEARLLRTRGHQVLIVAPARRADASDSGKSDWAADWAARGGDVLFVPARVTLPGVDLPVIQNTRRLREALERAFRGIARDGGAARGGAVLESVLHDDVVGSGAVQVVHVHSEFGLSAAAVSVARRLGLPTAQTVHTFFWTAPISRLFGQIAASGVRGFGRWLRGFPSSRVRLADAPMDSALRGLTLSLAERVGVVISPSAHQADRLREAGLRRVRVVPNAVAFDEAPGEPLVAIDGPLRIVWVGRLVPEKRLLEWVDAVVAASAVLPVGALVVEIVGEGPLRAEAEQRAVDAPITFLGRLPREKVQERMRAAHLVALTSHGFDNQPVTIVEALHARRGVFYVDPALTEGVDVAGLRTTSPDAVAMTALLVDLVQDPARVVSASARTVEGAREFDPDVHVMRILAAYRSV